MKITIKISKKEIFERFREDIKMLGLNILSEDAEYIGDYEEQEFNGITFEVEK